VDVSKVDKFEISKEEYEQRPGTLAPTNNDAGEYIDRASSSDTVLSYKKVHQMGRFAPPSETPSTPQALQSVPDIKVGERCEVDTGDEGLKKRGTVQFVGPTKFGKDLGTAWVGIEYDEPVGKNDGS